MTNLYILGDIHFSASRPWRLEMGDSFLNWLADVEVQPDSYLILLGDLSDSAVNPGKVISQLEKLAQIVSKKFKKTFILKGNHDEKVYQDEPHLSFEFLGLKPNIQILDTPADQITIGDFNVLALPHYSYRTDLPAFWDYYADLPAEIKDKEYDLTIGHFADSSAYVFDRQVNISYLKTKVLALGHIHTRENLHYTGSVYPCKISEEITTHPRAMWHLTKRDGIVSRKEIPLPIFCSFKYWDYPKPLPEKIPGTSIVWTIKNCDIESVAKAHYKDAHIRGVASAFQPTRDKGTISSEEGFTALDPEQVFKDWLIESKSVLSRSTVALVKKLLTKPTKSS